MTSLLRDPIPEGLRLPPLVLSLLGLVVAEAALGRGLRLRHGGHPAVHVVHPGEYLLSICREKSVGN